MSLGLLMRRYLRLRRQLSLAYSARPWPTERIDRLANGILATERLIARAVGDGLAEEPLVDKSLPRSRQSGHPHS